MIQTLLPFNAVAAVTAAARAAAMSFVAPGLAAQVTPAATPARPHDDPGFALGWDHASLGLTPPLDQLPVGSPLRQGWLAGQARFGGQPRPHSPWQRAWLALRLQAWQAGEAVETVQLNASVLRQIDTALCPVSRQPLRPLAAQHAAVHAAPSDADALPCRLNPAVAWATGNVALLQRAVAAAREGMDFDALWSQAQRIAGGECTQVRGLDGATWQRLAVLASFATPLAHARAACLPLAVLPPARVRVLNPVQGLQVLLTLQFTHGGYARRLLELSALMPTHEARQAFQIFMHTLLARRLAAGPGAAPADVRRALEDSWADPLVNRRWQRLALRLTAADCERLLLRASQRGLMAGGARWLAEASATEGWDLPETAQARSVDSKGNGACSARPGNARRRGSQKLAS
ncbi:hypothetical protein AACH10_11415 [Ideonella sp. DXS22W]|uniref:Uncharacterized protein n=1 Tax=Pseudaquabacterium inlustre TaxID=2984192 RepID=A0ABU9CG52_9BURK